MKNSLLLILILFTSFTCTKAQKFTTLTYFQNDTLKLELDLFLPTAEKNNKLPLVIYVHGGGFSGGHRTDAHKLCQYLSSNGYAVATISYTLYMKDKSFGCDGIVSEKIKAMQFGANDLWLATSYFIENSSTYNIDTAKIFIAGSSAGAETSLHAAFWDFNTMNMYNVKLPASFKYAGLLGGSGAIMDLNLITPKTKIPMMLFHGNGDDIVPYATAAHRSCKTNASGRLMLFGSYSIYNHLATLNSTVRLFTFCGGGHEYSGELFYNDPKPTLDFLNDIVAGQHFQTHTILSTGKKNEKSSAYKFCD